MPKPYFVASVAYLVVVALLARSTLSRPQARLTLLAGAVHLPAALFVPFLEPAYWAPVRTVGARFGVEDLVVTAAVASWAWYLVALRYDARMGMPVPPAEAFRRSLLPGAAIALAYLALVRAGVDPMTALVVTCAGGALALGGLRRDRWPVAAWGGASLAVVWFVLVAMTFALEPDFVHQWNGDGPWGRRLGGVPLGEVVWAVVYGAFWPLFMTHVFRVPLRGAAHAGR